MAVLAIINGLATLAWLAALGLLVLVIVRSQRMRPLRGGWGMVVSLFGLAVGLSILSAGLVFIQANERGVVISPYDPQGYRSQALVPGLHWIIPGESVVRYSISRQTYTMSAAPGREETQNVGDDSIRARTKDGQEVYIDASVIYAINPTEVVQLHIDWQDRYENGVVRALARGIVRDMASQYGVEEIVSAKRFDLENAIREELGRKLAENHLVLVDFVLRDIHFSEEYAAAVEQKQIAEQEALQAKFVVEQKKQEAEQARQVAQGQADATVIQAQGEAQARLIQAEAEAKALQMIAEVLKNNPALLQYQWITKIAPEVKVILLPDGSQFILPPEVVAPGTTPTPEPYSP
jgi:regulator of protease activity HflC (stomatin/prohibitin superfamily)